MTGKTSHGIERRAFLRRIAIGSATLAAGRTAWARGAETGDDHGEPPKPPLPEPSAESPAKATPPGRYVDVHVHLGTIPVGKRKPLTAAQLLSWMNRSEIARAWVLPLVSPEAFPNPVSSELVLDWTAAHRDRLVPFCAIDPRNSWYGSGRSLVRQLKQFRKAGAKGFGEHKPGIPIDDERNMNLYAGCAEVKLPVLFHLDHRRNTDQAGLPGLEKILQAFPEIPFIGHAFGFWASISGDARTSDFGGSPSGKVTAGGALDRLFDKYPNLYGDISANSGNNALTRDPKFTAGFLRRRADRLLFGTDYLTPGENSRQLALFERIDLPNDVQEKIARGNAERLIPS